MKFDLSFQRTGQREFLRMAIVALALAGVGLILYRDFVFGTKTLLFTDVGADSVNVFYPNYVFCSEYLRHFGLFSWSFQIGMGQNVSDRIVGMLLTPIIWLRKAAIAKAIVFQHLLYVIIAGVLFARSLIERGIAFPASLLGALLLSFSAYMCMGSCWYFHAYEVLCFTFVLFAAERAVGRGYWLTLPFAVAAIGLLGAFHFYLCALFLCLYIPLRFIEKYSWQPLHLCRVSVFLALAAFLGMSLTAFFSVNSLYAQWNSPRGSGPASLAHKLSSTPLLGFESSLHGITAILRPYANDILGTGSDFRGWQNYLEAPMTYCGLFCLVVFPQAFIGAPRRSRLLYTLFVAVVLILTVFPWFRYLFWAFRGDYYRTISLFSAFGVITLSMIAFTRYFRDRTLNLWLLVVTIFVLLGVLYFPYPELQKLISPSLRVAALILLISYGVLLVSGQLLGRQQMAAWCIIGLAAIELIFFDGITVSDRPTVTKTELTERVGYNDRTVEAVRDIKSSDAGFYRITKTFGSGPSTVDESLNDAMIFGYYSTTSYSSFNDSNYVKFLMAIDTNSNDKTIPDTRWSNGLMGHPLVSTFACEKYVITHSPAAFEVAEQYEFIRRYDDIYVFRNRTFLPFGLTYSRYLPEDVFIQMPASAKAEALLHTVIVADGNVAKEFGLSDLNLEDLKQKLREIPVLDALEQRKATALHITSFKQTQIEGTVRADGKSILVFQWTFDPGWRAFVDKRAVPTVKVDVGLLGVPVDNGEHFISLRYAPPFAVLGSGVSLCSLALLVFLRWKWPKINLPKEAKQ